MPAGQSGAEARAVQTLRVGQSSATGAKRLDCGRFIAALVATKQSVNFEPSEIFADLKNSGQMKVRFALGRIPVKTTRHNRCTASRVKWF
jgi:hypothetical protein